MPPLLLQILKSWPSCYAFLPLAPDVVYCLSGIESVLRRRRLLRVVVRRRRKGAVGWGRMRRRLLREAAYQLIRKRYANITRSQRIHTSYQCEQQLLYSTVIHRSSMKQSLTSTI